MRFIFIFCVVICFGCNHDGPSTSIYSSSNSNTDHRLVWSVPAFNDSAFFELKIGYFNSLGFTSGQAYSDTDSTFVYDSDGCSITFSFLNDSVVFINSSGGYSCGWGIGVGQFKDSLILQSSY